MTFIAKDFLAEIVDERTRRDVAFPRLVAVAESVESSRGLHGAVAVLGVTPPREAVSEANAEATRDEPQNAASPNLLRQF